MWDASAFICVESTHARLNIPQQLRVEMYVQYNVGQHLIFASWTIPRFSYYLTLTLLKWTKWWAPASASKWRMGFNSAFKGSIQFGYVFSVLVTTVYMVQIGINYYMLLLLTCSRKLFLMCWSYITSNLHPVETFYNL